MAEQENKGNKITRREFIFLTAGVAIGGSIGKILGEYLGLKEGKKIGLQQGDMKLENLVAAVDAYRVNLVYLRENNVDYQEEIEALSRISFRSRGSSIDSFSLDDISENSVLLHHGSFPVKPIPHRYTMLTSYTGIEAPLTGPSQTSYGYLISNHGHIVANLYLAKDMEFLGKLMFVMYPRTKKCYPVDVLAYSPPHNLVLLKSNLKVDTAPFTLADETSFFDGMDVFKIGMVVNGNSIEYPVSKGSYIGEMDQPIPESSGGIMAYPLVMRFPNENYHAGIIATGHTKANQFSAIIGITDMRNGDQAFCAPPSKIKGLVESYLSVCSSLCRNRATNFNKDLRVL